jgi:hypothetical protein
MTTKDSLEKISDVLNTNFEDTPESIQKESDTITDNLNSLMVRKNELMIPKKVPTAEVVYDQEEIRNGLKDVIINSKKVMEKLDKDLKIGTGPFAYQVYGVLVNAITMAYKELREFNKMIFDVENGTGSGRKESESAGKIALTASQVMELIQKSKDQNTMKEIKADFVVEDINE